MIVLLLTALFFYEPSLKILIENNSLGGYGHN